MSESSTEKKIRNAVETAGAVKIVWLVVGAVIVAGVGYIGVSHATAMAKIDKVNEKVNNLSLDVNTLQTRSEIRREQFLRLEGKVDAMLHKFKIDYTPPPSAPK